MEACEICTNEMDDDMVGCDHCRKWFHFCCVSLDEDLVNRIKYFYCDLCREQHHKEIEWKTPRASVEQRDMKRRQYHDVEEIVNHRIRRLGPQENRSFLIKWKGFSSEHNSWEPEANLDACIFTLQTYLKKHGLKYSRIDGFVGAISSSTKTLNEANWVKLSDVLEKFLTIKERRFPKSCLECSIFDDQLEDKDKLYFIRYESHCIVALFYHDKKLAYLADGVNACREDYDTIKELRHRLKCRIFCCDFLQQNKEDCCATSGILIALEFVRAYDTNILPNRLVSPSSWKRKLEIELHKQLSSSIVDGKTNVLPLTCIFCSKKYRSDKLKSLRQHQLLCFKKDTIDKN